MSKIEREREVRATLEAATVGAVEEGSSLYRLLDTLLDAHPRSAEKRDKGVLGFVVARGRTGREVRIVRPDGTEDPFSWRKCCGTVGGFAYDVRQAYREAVDDQIAPMRRPGMHVDHVAPLTFERLVKDFEAEHGAPSPTEIDRDGLLHGVRFYEPRRGRFAEYHRAVARLAVITAAENLSKPRIPRDA